MPTWLSPEEAWPAHPRKLARDAIARAKRLGWWLQHSEGHCFGRLRCAPPHEGKDGACSVTVFSTAGRADGFETARNILKVVNVCPHRPRVPADDPGVQAGEEAGLFVAKLERIADAADCLLRSREEQEAADSALSAAADQGSEDVLSEALDHERQASASEAVAYGFAAAAGVGEPWPPGRGPQELIEALEAGVEQLASSTPEVVQLKMRLAALQKRVRRAED